MIDRLPYSLLRRHVGRCSHSDASHRQLFSAGHTGETEIDNLDGTLHRQQDVGRLDVAVNDAVRVSIGESAGYLNRDRHGLSGGEKIRLIR